jgi:hypothetical protein
MIKILAVSIIYIIILFLISPVIDHAFSPLDEEDSELEILVEIIGQIIAVSIFLYVASEYIISFIKKKIGVKDHTILDKAREVIVAVITIGLQTHLVDKLKYITHKHPFRFLNLYD